MTEAEHSNPPQAEARLTPDQRRDLRVYASYRHFVRWSPEPGEELVLSKFGDG